MNHRYQYISAALLLIMLGACSSLPHAAAGDCPPAAARMLNTDELLRYHACLLALPPAQLAGEYASVKRESAQGSDPASRIRLALLLSLPNTPFYDPGAAIQLLDQAPATSPDLHALAGLLRASLAQQQQQAIRIQGLQHDLTAEKARSASLQDKINSIKNLERSMTPRTAP